MASQLAAVSTHQSHRPSPVEGALGDRPRKDEIPEQARLRHFHMVDKEVTPAPDGSSAVVVTYATHKGA